MSKRDDSPERKAACWFVSRGFSYEGARVEAVFSNRAAAKDYILSIIANDCDKRHKWKKEAKDYWVKRSDYLELEEITIFDTLEQHDEWLEKL
jgi:hypothetical protein